MTIYRNIIFLIFFGSLFSLQAQEKVTFMSFDSLEVTAEIYEVNKNDPYILLFHQIGGSRGEYRVIAKKLLKFGYNCIAVDLRSGKESEFVSNETAERAENKGISRSLIDSEKDILAAIDYAFYKNHKQVLLFGSSFSASLALKAAKGNPKVKAVIAFSPGEFFLPDLEIKDELKNFKKPVFVASSVKEYPYMLELFVNVPTQNKTVFKPSKGTGDYGTKSLGDECATANEYWLELLLFFRKLKE
ncbi:MAG: dienelactone hydrolase family protein [Bacteroidales bacterium]|nr:dienelactone hydrolase family protein [Bacteroidales bacterium]